MKFSAVPAAVNGAAETAKMSAQWLKRSVKSSMSTFTSGVRSREPKKSALTVMPGLLGKRGERMGYRLV